MTWRITDRLDLTGGIRYDQIDRNRHSSAGRRSIRARTQTGNDLDSGCPIPRRTRCDGLRARNRFPTRRLERNLLPFVKRRDGDQLRGRIEVRVSGPQGAVRFFRVLRRLGRHPDWICFGRHQRRPGHVSGRRTHQFLLAAAGADARVYRGIHTMRIYGVDPAAAHLFTGYQVPQVPKWSMVSSADFDWMLSDAEAHLGGSSAGFDANGAS